MIVDILIPRPGSELAAVIWPASGIAGSVTGDGHYIVDFEGNTASWNLRTFAERLGYAAGRLNDQYVTVARRILSFDEARDQTISVGVYDSDRQAVVRIDDAEALSAWAGESIEAIAGVLLPSGPMDLHEAMAVVGENAIPFWRDATAILVKTLAGQAVWFEGGQAQVFDHDDREL